MRNIMILIVFMALLSSCESKSGKLVTKPTPNASFTFEEVREDLVGNAPQSMTIDQMSAYRASGMARMCGMSDLWDTAVVKLYTAEDSAVYQWNKLEAKYIFITFKL